MRYFARREFQSKLVEWRKKVESLLTAKKEGPPVGVPVVAPVIVPVAAPVIVPVAQIAPIAPVAPVAPPPMPQTAAAEAAAVAAVTAAAASGVSVTVAVATAGAPMAAPTRVPTPPPSADGDDAPRTGVPRQPTSEPPGDAAPWITEEMLIDGFKQTLRWAKTDDGVSATTLEKTRHDISGFRFFAKMRSRNGAASQGQTDAYVELMPGTAAERLAKAAKIPTPGTTRNSIGKRVLRSVPEVKRFWEKIVQSGISIDASYE